MFLHGTDVKLNIGDTLLPGKQVGKDFGRSSHVYVVYGSETPLNGSEWSSAVLKAKQWAETAYRMSNAHTGVCYVYEVDVHGAVEEDNCDEETGKESFRCHSATITDIFTFPM